MLTQTAIRNASQREPATQPRRVPVPGAAMQTGTIELMGACMPFAANAEIYGENEPADYLYKVVSGTVRTYKVLVDGRRQIGAFHLPGDIFGLETGDEHALSAEAITDCKITVIKRSALMALAARDNEVAREMAERVSAGGAVELPMSRQDIGDYLGLTIETVSRTLKLLEDAAAIEVAQR